MLVGELEERIDDRFDSLDEYLAELEEQLCSRDECIAELTERITALEFAAAENGNKNPLGNPIIRRPETARAG